MQDNKIMIPWLNLISLEGGPNLNIILNYSYIFFNCKYNSKLSNISKVFPLIFEKLPLTSKPSTL